MYCFIFGQKSIKAAINIILSIRQGFSNFYRNCDALSDVKYLVKWLNFRTYDQKIINFTIWRPFFKSLTTLKMVVTSNLRTAPVRQSLLVWFDPNFDLLLRLWRFSDLTYGCKISFVYFCTLYKSSSFNFIRHFYIKICYTDHKKQLNFSCLIRTHFLTKIQLLN